MCVPTDLALGYEILESVNSVQSLVGLDLFILTLDLLLLHGLKLTGAYHHYISVSLVCIVYITVYVEAAFCDIAGT